MSVATKMLCMSFNCCVRNSEPSTKLRTMILVTKIEKCKLHRLHIECFHIKQGMNGNENIFLEHKSIFQKNVDILCD